MQEAPNRCHYLIEGDVQCPNVAVSPNHLCGSHMSSTEADLEVFRAITQHLRQDVREFWVRSNFYLLSSVALFSVFATLRSRDETDFTFAEFGVIIIGLTVAFFWYLVTRGAVQWISRWRSMVIEVDEQIDRFHAYKRVEGYAQEAPLMSPSNVTQYLPLIFIAGWLIMVALTMIEKF